MYKRQVYERLRESEILPLGRHPRKVHEGRRIDRVVRQHPLPSELRAREVPALREHHGSLGREEAIVSHGAQTGVDGREGTVEVSLGPPRL